ncbi:transmembrane protein 160 isoform X2 [Poeciliopsis prolifica]|uniref:transmembrane protein 160 isoform X2 n=1 Tax=Poeciliopsis prolifica TaxID=188132 RepID=UPI00241384AC|nr:transmembrane protein 160 isoform X2 [Poeciliopsis prolifica]
MAFLTLFVRRQLPRAASYFLGRPGRGGAPLRRLHGSARQRVGEKGPWGKSQRGPEQPLQQYHLTDLDKADALMLRKSHETAFFILGGVCVSFGGASYVGSLFALRRLMLLSVPALLLQGTVVGSVALFWLCAVSLYIGRLEVEIIHDDDEEEDKGECRECRERQEQRGHRGSQDSEDSGGKGQNK